MWDHVPLMLHNVRFLMAQGCWLSGYVFSQEYAWSLPFLWEVHLLMSRSFLPW